MKSKFATEVLAKRIAVSRGVLNTETTGYNKYNWIGRWFQMNSVPYHARSFLISFELFDFRGKKYLFQLKLEAQGEA